MGKRRRWISRQQLEEMGLSLEVTENNEYNFYKTTNGRKKRLNPNYKITAQHKYGQDISYPGLSIYTGEKIHRNGRYYYKQTTILTHVFVWLWFNGTLSDDLDIDHIDENKFNYKLENLQLLTRKENILKRGAGRNQYSYHLTDEEVIKLRAERNRKKQERDDRRTLRLKKKISDRLELEREISKYEETLSELNVSYVDTIDKYKLELDNLPLNDSNLITRLNLQIKRNKELTRLLEDIDSVNKKINKLKNKLGE